MSSLPESTPPKCRWFNTAAVGKTPTIQVRSRHDFSYVESSVFLQITRERCCGDLQGNIPRTVTSLVLTRGGMALIRRPANLLALTKYPGYEGVV